MREDYFYTEGLTVGYQGVPLIREIAFQLKKGEILTLIGPNGAGKTTILKSLIRQLKPLDGVIVLEGQKTDEMSGRDFARKLSVVLTERVRPEMMTCKDVVVQGNPRVYKALRDQLAAVLDELRRIEAGGSVNDELLDVIEMIAAIMDGMKEENAYGE